MKNDLNVSPATRAVQAAGALDPATGALVPPISLATTYERAPDLSYPQGHVYLRPDNPGFGAVETVLTGLEEGAASLVFGSGMAAATAVFQALRPGDHVIAPEVMYWALRNWLAGPAREWGLDVDFVPADDLDAIRATVRRDATKLIWIETPANPTWAITDIAGAAEIAHGVGAKLAVDSTVATPVLTRPLALGADIVMHSATKYLNGHSDVLAGALVTARQDALWERITAVRAQQGAILGPVEAALLLRGLRTLYLRVGAACASAQHIAAHLKGHPKVAEVLYPGLPDFPGHALAATQMTGGFGGMLSLRIAGGEAAAVAVAANVSLWTRATSLGGVESLIEHRASIEGAGTPVPTDLLRLSVGIEDVGDLVADLERALSHA